MPLLEQIRVRGPALLVVVLLHAGVIATIAAHRLAAHKVDPAPIVVRFLETIPETRQPPPPPPIKMERVVPTVVTPDLPNLPSAAWEIAATPAVATQPIPSVAQQVDTTSITQARFDADYLNNPAPSYPPLSRRMREQGTVILRVRVREDGRPAEVGLQQGSGHRRLDEAAMFAVRNWRFVPARRGQSAMESWVLVPIEFSLNT